MTARSTPTLPSPSRRGASLQLVHIADRDDPRSVLMRDAASRMSVPYRIVDYADIIHSIDALTTHLGRDTVIKIDSPGRSRRINDLLHSLGGHHVDGAQPHGSIVSPAAWYRGFGSVLSGIEDSMSRSGCTGSVGASSDILLLFDKHRCSDHLDHHGAPVPVRLNPPRSYEELRDTMLARRLPRVFVKLRFGSGASGIVALETSRRGTQAWTTVRRDGLALYNTRRIQRLVDEREVAAIIDGLIPHGVVVEAWYPKAGMSGRRFDLRIVVIAGRVAHTVVRLSRHPMTNLHLGGTRASLDVLDPRLDRAIWDHLVRDCERAAGLFGSCLQVAFDVAIDPTFRHHVILEANAFGDLLKGVELNGRSTYDEQLLRLTPWLTEQC